MNAFVAEIRIFANNFAPTGWAKCNGQIMPISQNTALFSLLGTTYGGNGQSNFALPNLQDSAMIQAGQGSGLSQRFLGETGGTQALTLLTTEMPQHSHSARAKVIGGLASGENNAFGSSGTRRPAPNYYSTALPNVAMSPQAMSVAGSSLPHNNLMPYLTLNFCIALQGIFPPRG